MKRFDFIFLVLISLLVTQALGQVNVMAADEAVAAATERTSDFIWTTAYRPSFLELIVCEWPWTFLFLCVLFSIPLGILSVIHSRRRTLQWPLATKLLILTGFWGLLLGLTGFAKGASWTYGTSTIMGSGEAMKAILAMNLGQSLYPLAASLILCLCIAIVLMVSMLIRHRAAERPGSMDPAVLRR